MQMRCVELLMNMSSSKDDALAYVRGPSTLQHITLIMITPIRSLFLSKGVAKNTYREKKKCVWYELYNSRPIIQRF